MSNSTKQLDAIAQETLMLVSHLVELDDFWTVAAWEAARRVSSAQCQAKPGRLTNENPHVGM